MALQFITDINVDFCDKRYILINAKQYDKNSRYLAVTCYNHGKLFPLNAGEHAAYIRYKKPDNHSVFNFCEINSKGKIVVELTEQMLAVEGIAVADLVIVKKGDASIDSKTGEITLIENASVLSSMLLNISVCSSEVDNADIESTYEFNLLNTNLETYWADFEDVMQTSKSWAVGDTGKRDGENTNNSKYWASQSKNSSGSASTSALNAAESERIAGEYKDTAILHSGNAQTYMNNASTSATKAANSASAAKTSETNAKTSETNALSSEQSAKTSELNAKSSEEKSLSSEQKAKVSETNTLTSEQKAKVSETNAAISEENARNAQSAAETAKENAEQAAEQAAQNAVDNVNALMSDYVTASQEAATSAANSEQAALTSESNANVSATNAKASEDNAKISETNAKVSEEAAAASATGAYNSEVKAFSSEANASFSEANASAHADYAKSYAVGDTGTRENENIDNAKYYYELTNNIVNSISTATVNEVKDYLGI